MTTLWRLLEAYHGVALYAPERARVYAGIGLDDVDTETPTLPRSGSSNWELVGDQEPDHYAHQHALAA